MDSGYRPRMAPFSSPRSSVPCMSINAGDDYDDVEEWALPYTHRAHLGKGGYGLVEEVEDRITGRVFARKVFHPRKRERARMKEMFENEARNIRVLARHHHMIQIHATYTTKDTLAMIMTPVADDGDLEKFLDEFALYRNEPAGQTNTHESTRMYWMIDVLKTAFGCLAAGLTFMHDQRIRHKDIKPSNILIHQGQVIYTDFGIARDTALFVDSATTGPAIKATRKYAAPEVLTDAARRSSSDVYSLGCVFIEIFNALTGSVNYPEAHRFADHMDSIHRELRMWNRGPHEMLILPSLILAMTEKDPFARRTASDIWQMCDEYRSMRCARCHSFHANTRRLNYRYSPWTYSPYHRKYYASCFSTDDKILDTLWSMTPVDLSDYVRGKPTSQDYLEMYAGLHGKIHLLDDRPGGHWSPWIWSNLHEQYFSEFVRASGTVLAVLWNSQMKSRLGAPEYRPLASPPGRIHCEKLCICTGFSAPVDGPYSPSF